MLGKIKVRCFAKFLRIVYPNKVQYKNSMYLKKKKQAVNQIEMETGRILTIKI